MFQHKKTVCFNQEITFLIINSRFGLVGYKNHSNGQIKENTS